MNFTKKIIAGIAIVALTTTNLFAYDLTDKEKAKGDKIAQKVLLLVSKKAEEKQAKFKEKIIVQLEGVYEKARKNEKMQALVGYVIEKVKSSDKAEASRYPGCDKDDIVLSNGQVWSACDVGSSKSGEAGEKFAWGSMNGYKDPNAVSDKAGPANDWNEKDPQGPCRNGYHVPSKSEVEKALITTKTQSGGLVEKLGLFGGNYGDNQTGYHITSSSIGFHQAKGCMLGGVCSYYFEFGIVGNYSKFNNSDYTYYRSIRCIKD